LLVLDNFEQVSAAAPVVTTLLSLGSQVKVLVTSRMILNLSGEHEYAVPPMRLPDPRRPIALAEVSQIEAVQLFAQRAQAAQSSFSITADNAAAVAELCNRLDGLPLAIELAAARIRLLPPQTMLTRLGSRLNLLKGGARDLPTRQQTLRQAIDWSYTLLSDAEKILFARLAVFVGGWTLEAAEAICNAEGELDDVVDSLEALLNSSLIRGDEPAQFDGQPRFRMLETIREFALEKLAERGESARLTRNHALFYSQQMQTIGIRIYSAEAQRHLAWIGTEYDNLRAALAWCLEPGSDIHPAIPIVTVGMWFWFRRGHPQEGREWCRRIIGKLNRWPPNPEMASMLIISGQLAMWQGDLKSSAELLKEGTPMTQVVEDEVYMALSYLANGLLMLHRGNGTEAFPSLENALTLFQEMNFNFFVANTLIHLGNASLASNDVRGAQAYLERATPLAEQVGEEWLIASILNNQGEVARTQRDYQQAQDYYEKSESLFRKLGDIDDHNRLIHSLGYIALYKGDIEAAAQRFHESLRVFRELGNRRGIAECLAGIARLSLMRGKPILSATLLSAATVIIHADGADWWPADQVEYRQSLSDIQSALSKADFDAAWKAGQVMTLEQAIAFE
ncbi:MAG: hypothetical protein EHM21_13105, partial [Chloroflexi bacterium]